MIKYLGSLLFLLGLSTAFMANGGETPPLPENRGLPFFDHILNLFEQKVNNSLAFKYHTAMINPGIEAAATGTIDAKLGITRRNDNETFTMSLTHLTASTTYQLSVFVGDNVGATNVTAITTDSSGSFFAVYFVGRNVRGGTPMPAGMHPIHGMRELSVVNAKSQVVLRADLVDPDALKYQATLNMHNPGFVPTASGSMRIRANPFNVELQLTAKNLRPLTDYMFLVNGISYKTVTSNIVGRLKFAVNDSVLDVFDIRTIALTDKSGNNVVLVLFPGIGNGIIPLHSTIPAVTATSPVANATGVALNATVSAAFNEGMDPSTITVSTFTLSQGGSIYSGTVTYDTATVTATFTPANNLAPNTTYTATLTTGVADLGGNALPANFTWSFTTAPTIPANPIVISTDPANLATGVAVNKQITATFNEAMDPTTINTATFLLSQTVSGAVTSNGNVTFSSVTATFVSPLQLLPNTSYTATITTGAKDPLGHALLSNYTWTFTTGADNVAPAVTSTGPSNLARGVALDRRITANFSEAMDPLTINAATFTLVQSVSGISSNGSVAYSGTTATFTPPSNLSPNTSYTATITTGAKDPSGNALANNFSWTFSTGTVTAQPAIALGATSNFAILAAAGVTNTAGNTLTRINGDIGVNPAGPVTGFVAGTLNGTIYQGAPVASQAQSDLLAAYNDGKNRSANSQAVAGDLSLIPGGTYTAGLYTSQTSIAITLADITLDAQGDSNAVFIFQSGSSFTVDTNRKVLLAGGAKASNVYWQVGSSATLNVGASVKGNILANTSITMQTGASLEGRALAGAVAPSGAVTVDGSTITQPAP